MYTPDNWLMLGIPEVGFKILAGWSGGYLNGDAWRLNSGVVSYDEDEHYYYFKGNSGSLYACRKNSECIRMNIASILSKVISEHEARILDIEEKGLPSSIKKEKLCPV